MKNDLRTSKTRRSIRNALIALLDEKGLSSITISELSARAEINRKTFYRHYASVYEVFDEIETIVGQEIMSVCKTDEEGYFEISIFFEAMTSLLLENRQLYKTIIRQKPSENLFSKVKGAVVGLFYDMLKSNTSCDDKTLRIYSEYVMNGVLGIYTEWLTGSFDCSQEYITHLAYTITMNGLSGVMEKYPCAK